MDRNNLKSFLLFSLVLTASIYALFISDNRFEKLQTHFKNCEYNKAIILADEIIKNPKFSNEVKKQSFIIKAVSEYSTSKFLDSQITFTELLFFDQNVQLSSKEISPKIISFFNRIRESLKQT
jgi:hypothetical protein